jgi:hypothetical protein
LATARAVVLGLSVSLGYGAGQNVRGVVADESNGVLPGVTIVARTADGSAVLGTTVTDGEGRYTLGPLAPGTVMVTFQLEAFAQTSVQVTIRPDADVVVNQRLAMAPRSETVVVVGKVPAPPSPPPAPPPPAPRPRPVTVAVPEHDHESVCGPAKLGARPQSFGTIRSKRNTANVLASAGDELVVNGGTRSGLAVGRNFAVRRTFRIGWEPRTEIGEHTAGLVQIVSADEDSAVAVVIYACDEIMTGDRLASFLPQPVRPPSPAGTPDYTYSARILFPDVGQLLGVPRRMLVIDQGASDGIRVGQRMTIFRRSGRRGNVIVGEAVVVAVKLDSATIRIEQVTEAIEFGDRAAPQR